MDFLDLFLNKKDNETLYYQLYKKLAQKIRSGNLPSGEKLPGKRPAAQQLGVSVNTVNEAYQMLVAEGYVTAVPRSGFVVAQLQGAVPPPAIGPAKAPQPQPEAPTTQFSFFTGDIDASLFPKTVYTKIYREVLASDATLLTRGPSLGDEILRESIASYLHAYRGAKCTAQQVVVGAGLEVLVGMLARLFAGQVVAVETPGYAKNIQILHNVGVGVVAIETDEMGMAVQNLQKSGAQLAYCTPSHQFPTGAVMPVGRRTQLLQWAAQGNHYIIEDDYDGEFRFDGRPLPCLQGLDNSGHVIYAGTFSRSLAPGIRAAYLVLPTQILQKWNTAYKGYACTVSRPEQNTLARFMQQGHFARSLNRMRSVYRARRNKLLQALAARLPQEAYSVQNIHTGLYFLLHVPGCNTLRAAQRARQNGVGIRSLQEYVLPIAPTLPGSAQKYFETFVVGYGGLPDNQVEQAAAALAAILNL